MERWKGLTVVFLVALLMCIPQTCRGETKEEMEKYAETIAFEYGISSAFVKAVIEVESSWDAEAYNDSSGIECVGLMQIAPSFHEERMKHLKVDDIYDPFGNITVGVDYLHELFERYGDPAIVLEVYNGDSRWKWTKDSGWISDYASSVLDLAYKKEHP